MHRIREFLDQFWLPIVALGILGVAIARYVYLGRWEDNFIPMIIAAFSFVCVVAADEVSDWTGWYGWTHQQYRNTPESAVRIAGAVGLIAATITLYYR